MQLIPKDKLHKYQLETIQKIKDIKKVGLFLEMGLGKTITTLTCISEMLMKDEIKKVLIVAPLRVANTVWKQEAEKWMHTNWLTQHIALCTGSIANKKKALESKHKILLTNKENVSWLNVYNRHYYDCIIIDESSAFKSASTQRFKSIRKMCIDSKYTIILTGTPSPNSLMDLWAQIFLLDSGNRLGKTISAYRSRFFHRDGFGGFNWKLNPGAENVIKDLIKDCCITLRSEDYIQLPDKIMINDYCEMDEKTYKQYKTMDDDYIIQIKGNIVEAINAATKSNKLLQFANGFMYDEEKNPQELHLAKIEALRDIIEDNPGENILVAYNFQHDLTMIKREFKDAVQLGKDGKETELWNKGQIKLLLAHPASAGHGLNLQFGGNIIIWFGLSWSLENYLQFNARLRRPGQTKSVRIIHLLTKKTNDDRALKVLNMKDTSQENLLNKLKLVILAEELGI